jgi:hypothetical protein
MNRIRAAYLELWPDLERHFVMSPHEDLRGFGITMGLPQGSGRAFWVAHIVAGTPTVVMILNGAPACAIAAIAALRVGAAPLVALPVGGAGYVIAIVGEGWYARRALRAPGPEYRPLFPTAEGP